MIHRVTGECEPLVVGVFEAQESVWCATSVHLMTFDGVFSEVAVKEGIVVVVLGWELGLGWFGR